MEFKGKLVRWDDERGFGFIRLFPSGKEVFIHITALMGMPRRPVAGDIIYFQVESGEEGKVRAKSARIEGLAQTFRKTHTRKNDYNYLFVFIVVFLMLILGTFLYYSNYAPSIFKPEDFTGYKCEGKQHCSQMTCKEARFYLKTCPDVKIDGDRDGIPCEDQCR